MSKQTDDARVRARRSNAIKDPEEWTTGAQASYLKTLASEAGEPVGGELTKAQASERIEDLQQKTGRGKES
jgi:hypothetical protein